MEHPGKPLGNQVCTTRFTNFQHPKTIQSSQKAAIVPSPGIHLHPIFESLWLYSYRDEASSNKLHYFSRILN